MEIRSLTVGMFQANCYLARDPATGACAIVDTGEGPELGKRLLALDPRPDVRAILITHAHVDHAGALADLQGIFDAPTYLGAAERPVFESLTQQGNWFGAPFLNRELGRIDHELRDGDVVRIGESELSFLHTPGHSPGHGCYYDQTDIFAGDLLFAGSIGRTDLPMGSWPQMADSLTRLFELPDATRVHCGHGPATTLARERATNPFLGFLRR